MRFPFELKPSPSRRLRAALFFCHLVALAALLVAIQDPILLGGGTLLLGASLLSALARRLPERIVLLDDGSVRWIGSATTAERTGTLLGSSTSFGWLTVLNIRFEDGSPYTQRIVLLQDSLSVSEHRQLQIWLRWIQPFRRASTKGKGP